MSTPLPPTINPLSGGLFLFAVLFSGLSLSLVLRSGRLRSNPDWIEYGFIVVMAGLGLAIWLGVALASLGWFSIERLSAALIVAATLVLIVVHRRYALAVWRVGLARPAWAEAGLVSLLALFGMLYARPHEFVFGAADAGVYVNMGAHIARTGSLLIRDENVAQLDPNMYSVVFRELPSGSGAHYYQFPGFYLSDTQFGLIVPQFFAAQAVSIAILTAIGGVAAGLYATPVWGVLGVAALYFFTRNLFGRRAALLAALFLGCTATQNWFSRYPTAEVLTQACLFAGLYALSRTLQEDTPGWGILAGLWLGLIFLARIDMILVAIVLVATLIGLALARRWRPGLTAFALVLGIITAHSVAHALILAWPYTRDTYRAVFTVLAGNRWPLWVVSGMVALVGIGLGWSRLRRVGPQARSHIARVGRTALILTLIVVTSYAYFIRPIHETPQTVDYAYSESSITLTNHENLVRIGWYVTPLGLAVALAGLCAVIWRERSAAVGIFVAIGLLSTFVYVINILNNPHQIYAMRRYVPVVLPAIMVWGAYGLAAASRVRDRRVVAIVGLVALGWLGGMIWQARIIGRQIDYVGTLDALTYLDRKLAPSAVVLMDDQSVVGLGDVIGTPLRYIFDHPVFVLRAPEALSSGALAELIAGWQRQGKRVYVIGEAAKDWALSGDASIAEHSRFVLETSYLAPTYAEFPERVVPVRYDLSLHLMDDTQR